MPYVYLSDVDCIMVCVGKAASTSIIRSGFGVKTFELDFAMSVPNEWEDKFRFAFVRNPFDRLVSAMQMFQTHPSAKTSLAKTSGIDGASLTIEKVLDVVEDESIDIHEDSYWGKLKQHAIPVTHPHYRIEEVDFLGRFETLEHDWRALAGLLSIDYQPLARLRNANRTRPYASFYDRPTRERAAQIFEKDLATYGYRFQSGSRRAA